MGTTKNESLFGATGINIHKLGSNRSNWHLTTIGRLLKTTTAAKRPSFKIGATGINKVNMGTTTAASRPAAFLNWCNCHQ